MGSSHLVSLTLGVGSDISGLLGRVGASYG